MVVPFLCPAGGAANQNPAEVFQFSVIPATAGIQQGLSVFRKTFPLPLGEGESKDPAIR